MPAQIWKVVDSAATTHERLEVTRNGARVAVLFGADDYDSLLETVAILSDEHAVASLQVGVAELNAGETADLEEARAAMVAAGRLTG